MTRTFNGRQRNARKPHPSEADYIDATERAVDSLARTRAALFRAASTPSAALVKKIGRKVFEVLEAEAQYHEANARWQEAQARRRPQSRRAPDMAMASWHFARKARELSARLHSDFASYAAKPRRHYGDVVDTLLAVERSLGLEGRPVALFGAGARLRENPNGRRRNARARARPGVGGVILAGTLPQTFAAFQNEYYDLLTRYFGKPQYLGAGRRELPDAWVGTPESLALAERLAELHDYRTDWAETVGDNWREVHATWLHRLGPRRNPGPKLPELTPDSLRTFREYAEDASNWSGYPWVSAGNVTVTPAMRGNLSDLVQKGLIHIEDYEGRGRSDDMYVTFTDLGEAYAADLGIRLGQRPAPGEE